jgi:hypothetical protein
MASEAWSSRRRGTTTKLPGFEYVRSASTTNERAGGYGPVDRARVYRVPDLGLGFEDPARSRDRTPSACNRAERQIAPFIPAPSDAIFRSALFGITLCRRGKMPQKIGEPVRNTLLQDIATIVTEAIADVRQSFPPEFCRLIS